jgi:uncharacterized protein (TIGR02266 family)
VAALNSVRIRLRYPDLDTFVEKFAPNVTRGGVFLASRNVQPVGSVISFEIQLVNGEVALAGQGKVTWNKEFNAAEPSRPFGMGVQFISVEPATRPTLARVLRARETGGLAPRRMTEPLQPLGDAARRTLGPGLPTGFGAGLPVDTAVDLVAEYGLDEATVRRVIDRSWVSLSGGRAVDDLGDLLKAEPVETITLAHALAELPRLLDPERSRRRSSGSYRTPEAPLQAAQRDPAEVTQQTDAAVVETLGSPAAADAEASPSEDTDMTGTPLHEPSTDLAEVAVAAGGAVGGGRRRKRRR